MLVADVIEYVKKNQSSECLAMAIYLGNIAATSWQEHVYMYVE